eukprot:10969794-Alexandrium_andersonii.AAC.1
MVVPGALFVICAAVVEWTCGGTPKAVRFSVADTGKIPEAPLWDYVTCLSDYRVVAMIFQYSACFGTELAMTVQLATHFR